MTPTYDDAADSGSVAVHQPDGAADIALKTLHADADASADVADKAVVEATGAAAAKGYDVLRVVAEDGTGRRADEAVVIVVVVDAVVVTGVSTSSLRFEDQRVLLERVKARWSRVESA